MSTASYADLLVAAHVLEELLELGANLARAFGEAAVDGVVVVAILALERVALEGNETRDQRGEVARALATNGVGDLAQRRE